MNVHQTRVGVETVLPIYSTLKFKYPVKVCAFLRNRPSRLARKRELASDMKRYLAQKRIMQRKHLRGSETHSNKKDFNYVEYRVDCTIWLNLVERQESQVQAHLKTVTHLVESRGVSQVQVHHRSTMRLTLYMYDVIPDMELHFFLTLDI
jgi:hypothetical protein